MQRPLIFIIGLYVLLWQIPHVCATQYHFERIAQTGPGIVSNIIWYSLNNSGQLAYNVVHPDGGMSIFRYSQGQTEILVREGDLYFGEPIAVPTRVTMNDSGAVAFSALQYAGHLSGVTGVFRLDSSQGLTKIAPLGGNEYFTSSTLDLSNSGLVTFVTRKSAYADLTIGDGTTITTVFDGNSLKSAPSFVDINASNQIAFTGFGVEGHTLVLLNGLTQTIVASFTTPMSFDSINSPSLNNSGKLVFAGRSGGQTTLYEYQSGQLNRVFDLAETDFTHITGTIGLNDQNDVMFFAGLKDGRHGLFTGPDAEAEKIIVSQQEFDGRTVAMVGTAGQLNNDGQFAFTVDFTNGEKALYLATPVPEPGIENSLYVLLSLVVLAIRRAR